MDGGLLERALRIRRLIEQRELSPASFRAELAAVPMLERDSWIDAVLGLGPPPDDGHELPQGCVAYVPCEIDVLVRAADEARIRPSDVVVDIGAGVGRAAAILHLLSGARVVGVEIQRVLVSEGEALAERLRLPLSYVHGDAAEAAPRVPDASVFFLYCPFSGDRLARLVDALEPRTRTHPLTVCAVDVPIPERNWLRRVPPIRPEGVAIYRSAGIDCRPVGPSGDVPGSER